MILGIAWPDIIIGAVIVISAFKGFSRGFVSELAGAIAVVASLITPWYYTGGLDAPLEQYLKLGPGSSHVVGMFLTGIATYAVIIAASWVLNRFAKLPILGIGNAIAGGAVGVLKGAVLMWFVLFIALYFPLSPDIRVDLHRSHLVGYLTEPNAGIDKAILTTVPWFAKPFVLPYFRRHHA